MSFGGGCRYLFVLSAHNHPPMNTTLTDRAAHALSGYKSTKNMMIRVDTKMLAECDRAGLFQLKGHIAKRDKNKPGLSHWIYLQMARALKEQQQNEGS